MVKRYPSLGFLLVLVLLLQACGAAATVTPAASPRAAVTATSGTSGTSSGASATANAATPGTTPANAANSGCPVPGAAATLPAEFPKNFPLPSGTVISSVNQRSGNRIVLDGFITSGDWKTARSFLESELPKAGFKVMNNEAEDDEFEAEADFEGNGYNGRWKVRSNPACPNLVTLSIVAGR